MSEVNNNAAETTTTAAENTATRETEQKQPEQPAPAEKTFTQKELDDLLSSVLTAPKRICPQRRS